MISDIETLFRSAWVRLCTLLMVVAVAVLGLAAAAPVAHAAEVGDPAATKGKTYKIGTDTTFAPFEYQEKGKMVGIDMELIQSIAKKEGFKIEIQASGFNAALQALSSNQVDLVIAGMSITDERKATYDFSDPYFQSGIQMAVAADNDDIKSYKDLDDKTVVAKTGSEGEAYAKEHAKEYGYTVTSVDQSSTMYEMVKSGNAVAVFDDYPVLAYGVSQHNGLKIVTPKVPHGEYGMAVNKGKNADLLAAIDDGLAQLISSGEYETIIAKYLGAEGAKAQVKAISGMVTDNDATATAKAKVGFLGLAKQSLPALMIGLKNTLFITVISFAIALLLGVAFGLMRVGENRVAFGVSKLYVAIFRGPSDSGVGVLLLLRRAAADRAQREHLDCRCADAVAQLRRLPGGNRTWCHPSRRSRPDGRRSLTRSQSSSVHGARDPAASQQNRHAIGHQPAGHHDQGFLTAAGHWLRRTALPGPAAVCGELPRHRNPAVGRRDLLRGHHHADMAGQYRR